MGGNLINDSSIIMPPAGAEAGDLERIINNAKANLGYGAPAAAGRPVEVEDDGPGKEPFKDNHVPKYKALAATGDDRVNMDFSEAAIGDFLGSFFDVISTRAGEHWRLSDTEVTMIAKPGKLVLDKYNLKFTPEMALMVACGVVFIPRGLITYFDYMEKRKNPQAQVIQAPPGAPANQPPPAPTPPPQTPPPAPHTAPPTPGSGQRPPAPKPDTPKISPIRGAP